MDPYLVIAGGGARRMLAQDLDRLKDRCSALEVPLQQAADALSAARATFEALHDEYNTADEQRQAVQCSLVRAIVGAVPLEILRAIFLEAARALDPSSDEINIGWYNRSRATLPFMLSAVSKRWRDVAFDIPVLWAYVALPWDANAEQGRAFLLRARALFKRSKSSPLDVVAFCPDDYDDTRFDWFQKLVREAAKHVHRWRRVNLSLHNRIHDEDIIFLREPTPLLEMLYISDHAKSTLPWSAPFPVYLPESPALRTLSTMTTFFSPVLPMTSLVSLEMTVAADAYQFLWDTLGKLPSLEDLMVRILDDLATIIAPFASHLHLASLKFLHFESEFSVVAGWKDVLTIPRIERLRLEPQTAKILLDVLPFIESACSGITSLEIAGEAWSATNYSGPLSITPDFAPLFVACRHVMTIEFADCDFEDGAFFSALGPVGAAPSATANATALVPELTSITFDSVTLTSAAADAFTSFVRQRSTVGHHKAQESGPRAPLQVNIVEGRSDFPRWLARQLRAILGENLSFVPYYAGEGLDDRDSVEFGGTEGEAEFTDSGDDASAVGESGVEDDAIDFGSDIDVEEDSDYEAVDN